jgi:branched-chain amino acid transport system substrate-binding protein
MQAASGGEKMRKSLFVAPVMAALVLGTGAASAQAVKIGVINTLSGPQTQEGDMLEKGIDLYFKLHQKDLPSGVTVELVKRDDTGLNPEVAKRLAQELVTRDHVNILTGFVWSPNFMSVAPVTNEAKVPALSMNAAAIKAVDMSPFMVRDSFTLTQQAYPLGKWAVKHGYKNAYTAVSDYAPGQEAAGAFAKAFKEAGGNVVGQVAFPPPPATPDFAPFLQRVKDAKPDVLYIFVPAGSQATEILKAARDLDFKKAGITLISTEDLVPEEDLPDMGDLAVGLETSGIYSAFAPRPANKAFVAAFHNEYKDRANPDFETADAWDGMNMIYALIDKTKGKFTGEEAMDFLSHWKDTHSVRGTILIDPKTRQVVQNVDMRRIEKKNGELVDVEFEHLGMMDALGQPYVEGK